MMIWTALILLLWAFLVRVRASFVLPVFQNPNLSTVRIVFSVTNSICLAQYYNELHNINPFFSLMSFLLINLEILGWRTYIIGLISLLVITFPFHIWWVLTLQPTTKEFKPHICTYHVVIIVINLIFVMLTLCYSNMSCVTLIPFYHASILTPHISIISHALLVATSMILWSSECNCELPM